jgi:hypothetical protein
VVSAINASRRGDGISLRAAAVIAGLGYLLNPVSYAEFSIYSKLVISGNIEQTAQNIAAHPRLFVAAILCYLISFVGDVVISWALYELLAPVNRAVSLLTAWFRLMYTAIAFFAALNLVHVYRLLITPDYTALFGVGPLHAQAQFLLRSFRYDWSIALIIFGIHLILLECLIYRSGYVPDGLGWMVDSLRPYLYPNANLGFVFITFFGELVFMLWLLIKGWKIQEPAPQLISQGVPN